MLQPESTSTPYTILRIKRKRNEEPLDALGMSCLEALINLIRAVVESRVRRKKSRGGMDVFQFAQTVEETDWKDEKRKKDLEAQISRLTREASNKEEAKPTNGKQVEKPMSPISRQQREDFKRRYTVLERDNGVSDTGRRIKKPPTVIPANEALQPNFKVYDAIPSSERPLPPPEPSSEIEKFIPLLNEYLSLHEVSLPQQAKKGEEAKVLPEVAEKTRKDDDDYVWDVFYRRPATIEEWDGNGNIATLTGLPPGEDDLYDSSSDSEFEDEADEDSNAEEYYKNDYPDEEDPDSSGTSDEFHEDSDFQDLLHDQDDGDDWR